MWTYENQWRADLYIFRKRKTFQDFLGRGAVHILRLRPLVGLWRIETLKISVFIINSFNRIISSFFLRTE